MTVIVISMNLNLRKEEAEEEKIYCHKIIDEDVTSAMLLVWHELTRKLRLRFSTP